MKRFLVLAGGEIQTRVSFRSRLCSEIDPPNEPDTS